MLEDGALTSFTCSHGNPCSHELSSISSRLGEVMI